MKRYFVTASMLAFGALAAIAPSASASALSVLDADAYFASIDVPASCVATSTGVGLMQAKDGAPQTLSSSEASGVAAKVLVLCNVDYTLAADAANTEQLLEGGLAGVGVTGTTAFSTYAASVNPTAVTVPGVGDTYTINLDATTTETAVDPGIYAFRLPLTVTCD